GDPSPAGPTGPRVTGGRAGPAPRPDGDRAHPYPRRRGVTATAVADAAGGPRNASDVAAGGRALHQRPGGPPGGGRLVRADLSAVVRNSRRPRHRPGRPGRREVLDRILRTRRGTRRGVRAGAAGGGAGR